MTADLIQSETDLIRPHQVCELTMTCQSASPGLSELRKQLLQKTMRDHARGGSMSEDQGLTVQDLEEIHVHLNDHVGIPDPRPIIEQHLQHVMETAGDWPPPKKGKHLLGRPVDQHAKVTTEVLVRFGVNIALGMDKGVAAHMAGVSYSAIRHHEVQDERIEELTEFAKTVCLNTITQHMFKRGFQGWLEPKTNKDGDIVTYVRKWSERAMEMLARKYDPVGFGGRDSAVTVNVNTGVLVAPTATEEGTTTFAIEEVDESDS